MRVLVTSCPGYGHLYPLIPLSWALTNAGLSEVAVHERSIVAGTATPEELWRSFARGGAPAVLIYQGWTYWVFRKRVAA